MSRFLIVTWDGAGNLVSTLGIARRLVESGHEVRLLGHRSIDERCGPAGWTFRPFTSAPEYDAVHPGDPTDEMPFLIQNVWFSGDVARDTAAELYVAHSAVLPRASVVVTHAGHGTVMAALAHGIPLVCMPMGRDQFFNAGRVVELGAGCMVPVDADGGAIADAVTSVLADPRLRDGAKDMAAVIAGYGGSADAVAELERLASA